MLVFGMRERILQQIAKLVNNLITKIFASFSIFEI